MISIRVEYWDTFTKPVTCEKYRKKCVTAADALRVESSSNGISWNYMHNLHTISRRFVAYKDITYLAIGDVAVPEDLPEDFINNCVRRSMSVSTIEFMEGPYTVCIKNPSEPDVFTAPFDLDCTELAKDTISKQYEIEPLEILIKPFEHMNVTLATAYGAPSNFYIDDSGIGHLKLLSVTGNIFIKVVVCYEEYKISWNIESGIVCPMQFCTINYGDSLEIISTIEDDDALKEKTISAKASNGIISDTDIPGRFILSQVTADTSITLSLV